MSNITNKITPLEKISKLSGVIISKDNLDVSVLVGLGSGLVSDTPEKRRIPLKKRVSKHQPFLF